MLAKRSPPAERGTAATVRTSNTRIRAATLGDAPGTASAQQAEKACAGDAGPTTPGMSASVLSR